MHPRLFSLSPRAVLFFTALAGAVFLLVQRKRDPRRGLLLPAGVLLALLAVEALLLRGRDELAVPAYGFMIMVAFVCGTYLAAWRAARRGMNPDDFLDAGLCAMVFGILGARALFVVQFFDEYFSGTEVRGGVVYHRFWNAFKIWQGGLVFYGGLIGAAAAVLVFLRLRRVKVARASDVIMPSVILGLAITRIGCFLNGCCFGVVTDVPWAVTFPRGSFAHVRQVEQLWGFIETNRRMCSPATYARAGRAVSRMRAAGGILHASPPAALEEARREILARGGEAVRPADPHLLRIVETPVPRLWESPLPVHPTELYASAAGFVIFGLLLRIARFSRFDGQVGTLFGVFYPVDRFLVEFLRGDNDRTLGLTISQWISIGVFAASVCLYLFLRGRAAASPAPGGPAAGESGGEGK